MLVLSRKQSETIRIGDDVVLTVLQVQGDRVRLGIAAPKNIPILRSELRIRTEFGKTGSKEITHDAA